MQNPIKIFIAILFIVCLFEMPPFYYQTIRYLLAIGFATLAVMAFLSGNTAEMIIYIFLTLLFQPLILIALGRSVWTVLDLIVAAILILTLFNWVKKPDK